MEVKLGMNREVKLRTGTGKASARRSDADMRYDESRVSFETEVSPQGSVQSIR